MNKQQLANKIWESANKMRSKIEANDYKDYILGFIFYKFLSEQEVQFLKSEGFSDEDIKTQLTENNLEIVDFVKENRGYFISYPNLFSTWLAKGSDFDIANVRDALSAFSRHIKNKKVFEGIFTTLETGLSKLGSSSASQTKAVSDLIHLIQDIPMNGNQDYDVLGFIYEYLIGMFAANAGKKAGEFYTPHEVSVLMSEIIADHLKDREKIQIYDPTSGSGSLLINIGQSIAKHKDNQDHIKYYAQELKQNTYNLTRMNLVMRGIKPDNIITRNADTLEDDWPYFDDNDPTNTYEVLHVDAVVSNPPYSQAWEPTNKESDPRYARFGLAPKTKADFAFLLHDLYHLKHDGIMTIVLPHGVLFRGGEEEKIRKALIEQNHIDAIIGLPANIFFGTGIPTVILVLRQKRPNTDVLVIDASKGFIKVGKNNKLQASHIRKIVDTVIQRKDVDKFAKVVSLEEIQAQGYNLNIPRYVNANEASESWDIYATMFGGIPQAEIDRLHHYWQAFPTLKTALFSPKNTQGYWQLQNAENIAQQIRQNNDVQTFVQQFERHFANYPSYLTAQLLQIEPFNTAQRKEKLTEDLFQRLNHIALIDPYHAYQLFDDHWQTIATDLEMIHSEGKSALKQVDPHLVIKKKDGKDVEVQEGWVGRILPFELVQQHFLADDLAQLKQKENRLTDIASELESLLSEVSEEDKQSEAIHENGDAFVNKELANAIKYAEGEFKTILSQAKKLLDEEKKLKTQLKNDTQSLHLATKTTLENLSDEQATLLQKEKWIAPLDQALHDLPEQLISLLSKEVQQLADKYSETLMDIQQKLHESNQRLANLLTQLHGSESDMQGAKAWQAILKGE